VFKNYLFSEESIKNVKPITWWLALKNNINIVTFDLVTQLHTTIASSVGRKAVFSFWFSAHKTKKQIRHRKSIKISNNFKAWNKKTEKTDLVEHEY